MFVFFSLSKVFLQLLQDGEHSVTPQTVLDVDMEDYKSKNLSRFIYSFIFFKTYFFIVFYGYIHEG